MLSKVTFADDTYDHIQTQIRAADNYFRRYANFQGIAIHYYDTFRAIVERAGTVDQSK